MMEIKAMYFSPTKTTEKIVLKIAETISKNLNISYSNLDITKDNKRENIPEFSDDDIFILGLPVYAGRVPEIVEEYIKELKADETKVIIVTVYGNRDYGDTLLEMKNILMEDGFTVIAAGAFIGEHSFTDKVATNRPDDSDLKIAESFADSVSKKIKENTIVDINVNGNYPYAERGALPPVTPLTNEKCTECMICVDNCPTSAINEKNPKKTDPNKCILCCECIKVCPQNAKYIDSEPILGLIDMLETNCTPRREPELFL